jgi:hypothetical protein
MNHFIEDIKTKLRAKFALGDISASESDQRWLLACIDVAALNGLNARMNQACDRMQAEIDRLEKHAGNGGIP